MKINLDIFNELLEIEDLNENMKIVDIKQFIENITLIPKQQQNFYQNQKVLKETTLKENKIKNNDTIIVKKIENNDEYLCGLF